MSEVEGTLTANEARQAMVRVWMAISAVWVAFWLLIATLFATAVELRYPFDDDLGWFGLIILGPPLALLAIGVLARWAFEKSADCRRVVGSD